jgi:hypothetical protein
MENFQNSKSNLAKLLATENITVEYRKAQTASFNVASRTLVLPIWNDMSNEMTDLMIGHEVGHALDTPVEYGDADLQGYGKGFRTFLNVIEDARIERRIKDRYPGLKRSFSKGYQEFMSRDFFEVNGKDVSKMLLIDRINLYFKIGPFFPVKFNEIETAFVKKVSQVETFDEVIAICKELYDYCKEELEDKRQEAMEEFQQKLEAGEFDDEMDGGYDDFDSEPNDDFEYKNPNEFGESDEDDEFDFDDRKDGYSKGTTEPQYRDPEELKQYDEVKSATDENLEKALRSLTEQKELMIGNSPSTAQFKYDNLIVSYKNIIGKLFQSEIYSEPARYKPTMITEFESKNKNAIAYLVKEFEMKKKAAELRRVVVSDTGVLDTNKLHTYKFNDDIFRKVGSVAAGKNHGIVIFVDWSGSMCDNMKGTIEQLITLTSFCRKVNVPFEVYAFTTEYRKTDYYNPDPESKRTVVNEVGSLSLESNWNLLNLFSSRMKTSEYRRMANDLLVYGVLMANYYHRGYIKEQFNLGGTPLNQTILAASGIVNNFRKAYKAEIVDVMFLTDGDDSNTIWTHRNRDEYSDSKRIGPATRYNVSYIEDKQLCKKYRVSDAGITPTLLQILKEKTGCNLIGFYILNKTRRYFNEALVRFNMISSCSLEDSFLKFKHEKFFAINNYGYDQYFLIPGGDDLSVEDEDLDDLLGENNTNVSARKLKGAFLKMNKNRLTNRVLLSKVIEEIA